MVSDEKGVKIFVTGGSGGLGTALVPALTQRGHETVLLSRKGQSGTVVGDLLDPQAYAVALREVDAVIHLAAVTHTNDHEKYFRVNGEGTRTLVRAAEGAGLSGRFLYVSTRAIGLECGAYGASKAVGEDALRASSLDWTIVRPAEVYGAAAGEAISKLIAGIHRMRLVPIPGDGSQRVAPLRLEDVISAMVSALESPVAKGKTYTLAGLDEFTYLELVDLVMRERGVRRPKLHIPIQALSAAAALFAGLRLQNPPIVRDQIPRLLGSKDASIAAARADLGFNPARLVEALRERE